MIIAGMYETSGDWLYAIGLPGKSGIGGGMVTVTANGAGEIKEIKIAKEAIVRGRAAAMESVRMTTRAREVTGVIGEGLSNKEIATRLNIATHTVKSHVRNVMEKLALHTRLQIAAYAHRQDD